MFASISKIIKDAKKGKMFILVDDENRENEGDLVIPASKIRPKDITFMAKHGRGLICLALDSKQVKKLNLQLICLVYIYIFLFASMLVIIVIFILVLR